MFAELIANNPDLTQADVEDFASFMEPEQRLRFLADVESYRH